jgi:hypothetical protein
MARLNLCFTPQFLSRKIDGGQGTEILAFRIPDSQLHQKQQMQILRLEQEEAQLEELPRLIGQIPGLKKQS